MARYISQHDKLMLLNTFNGDLIHLFDQGILIVGDPTTNGGAANVIDPTSLPHLFATDLDGSGTAHDLEHVGLGSLNGKDYGGTSLAKMAYGYRGKFFMANPVVAGTETILAGQRWQVTSGSVTYGGVAYSRGDVVETTYGTNFVNVSSGRVAPYLPLDLVNACNAFREEEYKIKNLKVGDEVNGYWDWNTGYTARNSVDPNSDDFIGYVRT